MVWRLFIVNWPQYVIQTWASICKKCCRQQFDDSGSLTNGCENAIFYYAAGVGDDKTNGATGSAGCDLQSPGGTDSSLTCWISRRDVSGASSSPQRSLTSLAGLCGAIKIRSTLAAMNHHAVRLTKRQTDPVVCRFSVVICLAVATASQANSARGLFFCRVTWLAFKVIGDIRLKHALTSVANGQFSFRIAAAPYWSSLEISGLIRNRDVISAG